MSPLKERLKFHRRCESFRALQAPFMHRRGKMGLLLRLLVITSLCLSTSSAPLDDKPFLSDLTVSRTDPLLENNLGATGTHGISSIHDDSNERSGIVHSSKFAHGGSAHGHGRGGGAADNGHGRGGGAQGGRAAVPVIIAGAAANHRPNNHHNAGNRQVNCIVPTTLITTTFVALIVH